MLIFKREVMIKKIIYITILTALTSVSAFTQTPAPSPIIQPLPQMSPTLVSLETIINEAEKQTVNYREAFKNLLAVETKTFEKYNKNGEMKDQKVVESNFFVYESPKDATVSSELRNVTKVDGKPVPDSQARADRFLAELQKTNTIEKELEKIQSEGSRYDKTLEITGLTLFEGFVLYDVLRPFFEFKLLGSDNYQGNEVYVVSYQQTKKSPSITINEKEPKTKAFKANFDASLPGLLKKSDAFLRGKLLIDKRTFQIRREERELTVQNANPLVVFETIYDYQSSDFGILVPKQISFTENSIKKTSNDNQFSAAKNAKITFDYSQFRKSDSDVKILDDN